MVSTIDKMIAILIGVPATFFVSFFSFIIGFAIGLPLAFVRTYMSRPPQILVDIYEKFFRGIPEIVLMLLIYMGLGLQLKISILQSPFVAATLALGLRSGANQSQTFRGAIRGIGDDQMIAAQSLGLTRVQSIRNVMIPQTFIISTPGLASEYALLIKDSSYAYAIGLFEIMTRADKIRKANNDLLLPFIFSAFLYILLTFPIATYLDTWGGRKKKQLGL